MTGQEVSETKLTERLEVLLKNVVSRKLFKVCPMITSAEDDAWESDWQEMIYGQIQLPPDTSDEDKKRLWNDFARPLSREIVNRRRQNTTGDMKNKFKGTPQMHIGMIIEKNY